MKRRRGASSHHASRDAILQHHAHLTKHPVDRAATCGRCIQREISPWPLQTFTRAEMRALRKRSLLGLAVEKRSGRNRRPRSPPRVCLPVVRSRGKARRDRRLRGFHGGRGAHSIINCEIRAGRCISRSLRRYLRLSPGATAAAHRKSGYTRGTAPSKKAPRDSPLIRAQIAFVRLKNPGYAAAC